MLYAYSNIGMTMMFSSRYHVLVVILFSVLFYVSLSSSFTLSNNIPIIRLKSVDERSDHFLFLYTDTSSVEERVSEIKYFQIDDFALRSFRCGDSSFIVVPNALSENFIYRLRLDSKALEMSGFGQVGVSVGRDKENSKADTIRKNVHQTWLQSCHESLPISTIGDIDARKYLFRAVEDLCLVLVHGIANSNDAENSLKMKFVDMLHPRMVELSYLSYQLGSFYKRHIDTFQNTSECANKRIVSLILYLGSDDDPESDWREEDGGSLRIFTEESGFIDILPQPGTLVLLNSNTVPHEVLESKRSRRCIAGWLNAPSTFIE